MNNNYRNLALRTLAAGVLSVALVGCSDSITAPETGSRVAAADVAAATNLTGWTQIAYENVPVGRQISVSASRYTVMITKGAYQKAFKLAMYELSPSRIDVNLEPDGIEFDGAVYMSIDYSGSRFDPDAPNYAGVTPCAGRWDPVEGLWKEHPGSIDENSKTVTLPLYGFSRYGLIVAPNDDLGRDPSDNFEDAVLD
jgi:hypothetical protein